MPPFPHTHAISNRAAAWIAPRHGGRPGVTQSGPEVERVSGPEREFVMQHQTAFVLPPDRGRQGLIQISTPTEDEGTAAAASVREAFDRFGSVLAQPVLA